MAEGLIMRPLLFLILAIDFFCEVLVAATVQVCNAVLDHLRCIGVIKNVHCLNPVTAEML